MEESDKEKSTITALEKALYEKGEYGYSQYVVDALTKERNSLQAQLQASQQAGEKMRNKIAVLLGRIDQHQKGQL
jgi:hypothetical protein